MVSWRIPGPAAIRSDADVDPALCGQTIKVLVRAVRKPARGLRLMSEQNVKDDSGDASKAAPSSLWRTLQISVFRNLLIADVVSDVGTFMQSVGAAWLMVSLRAGPLYVSLIQTASALPFFLFALLAGALGDIVDRRKLILFAEIWMTCVALVLFGVTITGHVSPLFLLMMTFAFSAGDAFESPAWRAVLPELVPKDDLAPAS